MAALPVGRLVGGNEAGVRRSTAVRSQDLEFRVLGPLEVSDGERTLALGGVKQRSLLAILLQQPNAVVSTGHLLAELWGDAPPATADKCIHVYVSRLRKEIGPHRLVTRPPGYALRVDPAELDVAKFERLRAEGRPREALALWRGPAYDDLSDERCVQGERERLEDLRLAAVEEQVDSDLAAGRHVDLVSELETLIARHPLRERLRGQLMLALYRSARQAEALDVYRAARHEFSEALGLEPGGELRRLERAILQQDPALDLPTEVAPGRSILVVPASPASVDRLLALAQPLKTPLVVACVVPAHEVGAATAALAARDAGRVAAFSSPEPGPDIARLATREACELIVMDGTLDRAVLEDASCDVAVLFGAPRDGPVLVPFGAGRHDWAALELGARIARATGAPLRLAGAIDGRRRDASRLLADASLIVQRRSGVVAEPWLAPPGRRGMLALAEEAGLLVVGLPDRWHEDGLGRARSALLAHPTLLVRRGAATDMPKLTRHTWSLTA